MEVKKSIFRNIKNLREDTQYTDIRVRNDLTQQEREKEKLLKAEAKKKRDNQESGEFMNRFRGPPWNRRIIRINKDQTII